MPAVASRLSSAPRPNVPFDIPLTHASSGPLVRHLRAAGAALDGGAAGGRCPLIDAWPDDRADRRRPRGPDRAAALGAALPPLRRNFSPNPDVLRGVEPRHPAARTAFDDEAGMSQGRLEP